MEMGPDIERGDGGASQIEMGVTVMRLRKALARLLTRERVCRVATVGQDGMPHVVPVCHVLVDGKVCFGTGSDSQKVRNLQADPHLAVPVDLYSEDWKFIKGIMLQGLPGSSIVGPRSGRFERCCTGNTRSTPTRPVWRKPTP